MPIQSISSNKSPETTFSLKSPVLNYGPLVATYRSQHGPLNNYNSVCNITIDVYQGVKENAGVRQDTDKKQDVECEIGCRC